MQIQGTTPTDTSSVRTNATSRLKPAILSPIALTTPAGGGKDQNTISRLFIGSSGSGGGGGSSDI